MSKKIIPSQKEITKNMNQSNISQDWYSMTKEQRDAQIERWRKEDNEIVRGTFKFYAIPGGTLDFYFKKYKKDGVQRYKLVDGRSYELPLMVAKHLNENCFTEVHEHALDELGLPSHRIGQKNHRCGFHSTDFESSQKVIYTVEKTI